MPVVACIFHPQSADANLDSQAALLVISREAFDTAKLNYSTVSSDRHHCYPTFRYFVQLGEATLAGLSYIQADIEDSPVVCMTRQAAIYGRVHDRYGAHAHERHHAISSYIRSDIRIERRGCFERKFLRRDLTTRWVNP